MSEEPELRQDPISGEWVIIAPRRARRPHQYATLQTPRRNQPPYEASCPFCPGHEQCTPPALQEIPAPDAPQRWAIRVVPNKFAALVSTGTGQQPGNAPLFPAMPGIGHHEVIIDSPTHNGFLPALSLTQATLLVRTWRDRYRVLQRDTRVRHILLFKNHGASAGASLVHPHTQLLASPVVPVAWQRRYEHTRQYFARHKRCLLCDLLRAEQITGTRLLCTYNGYVAYHPFASRFPFEVWIVPHQHQACFSSLADAATEKCAQILQDVVGKVARALGDPDYNLIVHTAHTEQEANYYHWYIQLIPRLVPLAGVELGTGMTINPVPPEEAVPVLHTPESSTNV